MRASIRLGVLLLACAASGVAAQDASSLLVNDREASTELAQIIESTKRRGLPVDPIIAKVRYAVLVGRAPAPRIVASVRAMAARLEDARSALAPEPTEQDIAAGEDALYSGVSRKSLLAVRRVSPNRPVAVPLGVLAQLVVSKVPEDRAAKYVTDLIKRGATAEQLVALGNDVNTDVSKGTLATSALELRMNRLNAVLGMPSAAGDAAATLQSGDPRKKP